MTLHDELVEVVGLHGVEWAEREVVEEEQLCSGQAAHLGVEGVVQTGGPQHGIFKLELTPASDARGVPSRTFDHGTSCRAGEVEPEQHFCVNLCDLDGHRVRHCHHDHHHRGEHVLCAAALLGERCCASYRRPAINVQHLNGWLSVIIPPAARYMSVFVYFRNRNGTDQIAGSAFAVTLSLGKTFSSVFLVTARHVIEGCRKNTDEEFVLIRLNTHDGGAGLFQISFDRWKGHPKESVLTGAKWFERQDTLRYDVAAAFVENIEVHGTAIQAVSWPGQTLTAELAAAQNVGAGDDVAIIGVYRNHVGKQRNIPVVRSGVIAAMPEEPVETFLGPMEAYLIEARSIGGVSGSPVYWVSGRYRWGPDGYMIENDVARFSLMGLVHGHFDSVALGTWPFPERMNEGMSIVAPLSHIHDVLFQDGFATERVAQQRGLLFNLDGPVDDGNGAS